MKSAIEDGVLLLRHEDHLGEERPAQADDEDGPT